MVEQILVTGSGGLIGSETVRFYAGRECEVYGLDNNKRADFFGEEASTQSQIDAAKDDFDHYTHFPVDIRDQDAVERIFNDHGPFDLIVHTAAQPSHDWAREAPHTDFGVNATGTLVLLDAFRKKSPEGVFVFTSSNKVYGDRPNDLPLVEQDTRWELPDDHPCYDGIDETMSIDQSTHSLYGVSKASADLMVQEYGHYFGLKTACFRGGCLTGPQHAGTELHGFLAYLMECVATGTSYTIYGHKGKQVRDNIHSEDLVRAFDAFFQDPREGAVYNIGGSRKSNCSLLEAIDLFEEITGKSLDYSYSDDVRTGDHKWWISDVSKFRNHYPDWNVSWTIEEIAEDLYRRNYQ